jgi:hypothetical protein
MPAEQPELHPAMIHLPSRTGKSSSSQVAVHKQPWLCFGNCDIQLPASEDQRCADSSACLGSHSAAQHIVDPKTG